MQNSSALRFGNPPSSTHTHTSTLNHRSLLRDQPSPNLACELDDVVGVTPSGDSQNMVGGGDVMSAHENEEDKSSSEDDGCLQ